MSALALILLLVLIVAVVLGAIKRVDPWVAGAIAIICAVLLLAQFKVIT